MIVGIDFGTTNMRVAAIVDGRPVIIENAEGDGSTPSVVALRKGQLALVGTAALRDMLRSPSNVVSAAKRLIGRSFHDSQIQILQDILPFKLIEAPDGTPCAAFDDQILSPQDICTILFENLRSSASRRLGKDVSQAVIAVPAYYGDSERKIIKAAAAKAGIETVRMVSEPTAAALFHGFGRNDDAEPELIAVYDLGGGTFDFSLLEVGDGVFAVLATGGDTFLGGEDFDFRLQTAALNQHALRVDQLTPASRQQLKRAAEDAKIVLSGGSNADIWLDKVATVDGREVSIDFKLTASILQDLIQDLVDRTLAISQETINEARDFYDDRREIKIDQIDKVILVGGSTRLPLIEECVSRLFGKPVTASGRREDSVALGCAVQAGVLSGAIRDVLLLDVLPHTLGARWHGCTMNVLERHTTIPCKRTFEWAAPREARRKLTIEVFEGDVEKGEDRRIFGELEIGKLEVKDEWSRLAITMDVDANGKLTAAARDLNAQTSIQKSFDAPSSVKPAVNFVSMQKKRLTPARIPQPTTSTRKGNRILVAATEWRSGAGGLSTFNRSFCKALSAAGQDVRCLAFEPGPYELQSAREAGVELVPISRTLGRSDELTMARKPKLPDAWLPDIIVGHGRITGPIAAVFAEDHFPSAKRLHIIHMAPDEIEWFKTDRLDDAGARAAERTEIERELARTATYSAAVGPRLHQRFLTELAPSGIKPMRIDPGFDSDSVTPLGPPPGQPFKVLIVGRAEDLKLKGLDIAARAFGELLANSHEMPSVELLIRGAPDGQAESLRRKLIQLAGKPAKIIVRPYDSIVESLDADYRRASVVLMPSRTEGFGLVGLEAIVAGVPVLISSESGLAQLVKEALAPEVWRHTIVDVKDEESADRQAWAIAIRGVLHNREAAFARSSLIRENMARFRFWSKSVADLLNEIQTN